MVCAECDAFHLVAIVSTTRKVALTTALTAVVQRRAIDIAPIFNVARAIEETVKAVERLIAVFADYERTGDGRPRHVVLVGLINDSVAIVVDIIAKFWSALVSCCAEIVAVLRGGSRKPPVRLRLSTFDDGLSSLVGEVVAIDIRIERLLQAEGNT